MFWLTYFSAILGLFVEKVELGTVFTFLKAKICIEKWSWCLSDKLHKLCNWCFQLPTTSWNLNYTYMYSALHYWLFQWLATQCRHWYLRGGKWEVRTKGQTFLKIKLVWIQNQFTKRVSQHFQCTYKIPIDFYTNFFVEIYGNFICALKVLGNSFCKLILNS